MWVRSINKHHHGNDKKASQTIVVNFKKMELKNLKQKNEKKRANIRPRSHMYTDKTTPVKQEMEQGELLRTEIGLRHE